MKNKPLVSVVIPLFNKGTVIKKSIDSVLSQTYHNFEIVVVDDGSTDHSVDAVRQYEDSRISIYLKSNGGPSSARNYGIKKSKGNWILFLDADDVLLPDALEKLVEPFVEDYSGIDIVCGNFNVISNSDVKKHHLIKYHGLVTCRKKMYWLFIGNCFPRTGAALIRKELLSKHQFPENLRRFEDMCVMIEWVKNGQVYLIPDVLFNYYRDTANASKPAKDYNMDFIFHMNFSKASFWEKCLLANLYEFGLRLYPQQRRLLKRMYGRWDFYRFLGQIVLLGQMLYRRFFIREY